MKLSMMPQTVPNRPTKGAVAPIVARTPVPRAILRPAACSIALELPGDALLEAVGAQAGGKPDLVSGRLHQNCAARAGAVAELLVGLRERRAILQRAQVAPYRRARAAQFEPFGEPDRPGDQRSDGKADHHRFHDDVGMDEHAPRGEILRQLRGADRGLARG